MVDYRIVQNFTYSDVHHMQIYTHANFATKRNVYILEQMEPTVCEINVLATFHIFMITLSLRCPKTQVSCKKYIW